MSRYPYQMVCDLNQLLACSQEKRKESEYEVEKGRKGENGTYDPREGSLGYRAIS